MGKRQERKEMEEREIRGKREKIGSEEGTKEER